MTSTGQQSRRRSTRRLRRWARHTPNGEIALTMMAVGSALLLGAVLVIVFVL